VTGSSIGPDISVCLPVTYIIHTDCALDPTGEDRPGAAVPREMHYTYPIAYGIPRVYVPATI
jgi:hypothetical protein